MNWETHCKKNRIRFEYETDVDVEFIAPKGKTFSTGSRYRVIDTEIESNEEIIRLLDYS